jgi:hypothetical protein
VAPTVERSPSARLRALAGNVTRDTAPHRMPWTPSSKSMVLSRDAVASLTSAIARTSDRANDHMTIEAIPLDEWEKEAA